MTRTNPRQPLWQRVKEEADYKTLGSAHDRQKLSTLADGARWEHGADAEKLSTYAARHAAAQPAYDAAAARYAADDAASRTPTAVARFRPLYIGVGKSPEGWPARPSRFGL